MTLISAFFRWLLNINTIWGSMILIAFGLCVWQHYAPTNTIIPADMLAAGENTLTIQVTDGEGNVFARAFQLIRNGDELDLPQAAEPSDKREPFLIAAQKAGDAFVISWDFDGPGTYVAMLGEQAFKDGDLVTLQSLTDAAFDYAKIGFEIALGLIASFVLLLGLMRVGEDAGFVQIVAKVFYPIIRFLFPDVPRDHPALGAILMNWTTTLLGLGNAATPFGLKAMKELQSLNKNPDVASDSQIMLLGYNTAGLAIIPTSLLAVRKAAGCSDPFEIIGTCLVAGLAATLTAILMAKLLGKLPMFTVRAALVEGVGAAGDSGEQPPPTAANSRSSSTSSSTNSTAAAEREEDN